MPDGEVEVPLVLTDHVDLPAVIRKVTGRAADVFEESAIREDTGRGAPAEVLTDLPVEELTLMSALAAATATPVFTQVLLDTPTRHQFPMAMSFAAILKIRSLFEAPTRKDRSFTIHSQ